MNNDYVRKVWKFPLVWNTYHQVVKMPAGFIPLHVAFQDEELTLWAEVNAVAPLVRVQVWVAATGERLQDPEDGPAGKYVGTVHRQSGTVWHVYVEAG